MKEKLIIDTLKNYELFKNEEFISLKKLKNQGFNNTNYMLTTSKQVYLIRKFQSNLSLDRKLEFEICLEAYKKKIGAKPLLLDEKNFLIICNFLEGKHKYRLKKQEIRKVALLLKKIHQIKMSTKFFNKKRDFVLCHHDLNPKNFIFSKDIKLIDWEYARFDDRYFDLATVVIEFNLNKKEEKLFLKTYFQNPFKIDRNKISFFKVKYFTLCIDWFSKQNHQKEKIKYKKQLCEYNKR